MTRRVKHNIVYLFTYQIYGSVPKTRNNVPADNVSQRPISAMGSPTAVTTWMNFSATVIIKIIIIVKLFPITKTTTSSAAVNITRLMRLLIVFFPGPCNGYQCSNGYCISNALRCNGVNDCSGGEDEQNCGM